MDSADAFAAALLLRPIPPDELVPVNFVRVASAFNSRTNARLGSESSASIRSPVDWPWMSDLDPMPRGTIAKVFNSNTAVCRGIALLLTSL